MSSSNKQKSQDKKLYEAKDILKELGLDQQRQNDRSAWTLLALLDVKPSTPWKNASNPFLQTYIIMEFMKQHYGKEYKPNSRETIRRQTLHQFEQYRLVDRNRDNPSRPTNSKDNNYSITHDVLEVIKLYPSDEWKLRSADFKKRIPELLKQYEEKNNKHKIHFTLPNKKKISLSPGKHNQLHCDVVEKFIPHFIGTENAEVLYVGDTASSRKGEGGKLMYIEEDRFKELGLPLLSHDKLPDLVVFDNANKWLFLIEAVTSHGPVSTKRYLELEAMFKESNIGLVYVTAFPDNAEFRKNAADIAWETEVWISDKPEHMIHFNGDRFLGAR